MDDAHARLTSRQLEIASHLGGGIGIAGIATTLVVSIHTVRGHVRALHRATDTHDLVSLAGWIQRHRACCLNDGLDDSLPQLPKPSGRPRYLSTSPDDRAPVLRDANGRVSDRRRARSL